MWSVRRPLRSKHTSSRIERPFSARSVPRGYKKDKEYRLSQLSLETPACQDMSLEAEELNWWIEASELLSAVQWSWKSGCEEKTLCVL
jgi:hypothetical protein